MTMKIAVLIAVILGLTRGIGLAVPAIQHSASFQAIAHLFLGFMLAKWYDAYEPDRAKYRTIVLTLSIVEIVCSLIPFL